MTDFLVRHFVKDCENFSDVNVRKRYGDLSGAVGIICNTLLFFLKLAVGTASGSVSVISDAFNNLSDCANCFVTLFGFRMAAKPADKEHPFGHGRAEYLTSLTIAAAITAVGAGLLKTSAEKIVLSENGAAQLPAAFILLPLVFSIAIKFWMSVFNSDLGKRIGSDVLLAVSKDSRGDMLATSAAIIGSVSGRFTSFPADGVCGAAVSLYIIMSGFSIIHETADSLLGKSADPELYKKIEALCLENERIYGIHDLIIHDYGPGNLLGSCHVEVSDDESLRQIHEIVDAIERRVAEKLSVRMTIHIDPLDSDGERTKFYKALTENIMSELDDRVTFHDFRISDGENRTKLIFDMAVPYDCEYTDDQLKFYLDSELMKTEREICTVITFDRR